MSHSKHNARTLIIDLLLASGGQSLSVKQLVNAAQIFAISENSIRVAVTRLLKENKIESTERGIYQLSKASYEWASIILDRAHGIKATKQWNQQYLAVFTNAFGRVDRTALARRERALQYFGFCELETGIYIRPDNLSYTLDEIFKQLIERGLELDAKICMIQRFDEQTTSSIPNLWNIRKLNQNYQKYNQQLELWFANLPALSPTDAARESFLLGRETIVLLMKDPLLPESFIDVMLRQKFIENVLHLDKIGQEIWHTLNKSLK